MEERGNVCIYMRWTILTLTLRGSQCVNADLSSSSRHDIASALLAILVCTKLVDLIDTFH